MCSKYYSCCPEHIKWQKSESTSAKLVLLFPPFTSREIEEIKSPAQDITERV